MNTGALLFAFDSEIKYTKLAIECAKRIQQYLDIPVSLKYPLSSKNKNPDSRITTILYSF